MTEECDNSKVLAFCFKCSPTPLLYANIYFKVIVFNVVGFFFMSLALTTWGLFPPRFEKNAIKTRPILADDNS